MNKLKRGIENKNTRRYTHEFISTRNSKCIVEYNYSYVRFERFKSSFKNNQRTRLDLLSLQFKRKNVHFQILKIRTKTSRKKIDMQEKDLKGMN